MSFTLLSDSEPKARKKHCCQWCGESILVGETYYRYSGLCDNDFQSTAMHLECKDAMWRNDAYDDELPPFEMVRGKTEQESEEIWEAERRVEKECG